MSDFHTYSSWGRTRQPKNIKGAHKRLLNDADNSLPKNTAPTLETDGYATENQRFLHLLLENELNVQSHALTIWGFSYAAGKWGKLYDVSGTQIEFEHINQAIHKYYIFEIAGVDRLYFEDTGNADFHDDDYIAAALSTF